MANSSHTFYAGYLVATTLYVAYVVSLWVRTQRAKRRVDEHRTKR